MLGGLAREVQHAVEKAAQLGGDVTIVDRDGLGGAAVLTDCVPSKTLISTADYMSEFETAAHLGVHLEDGEGDAVSDAKAELAKAHGCAHTIVYTRENFVERV